MIKHWTNEEETILLDMKAKGILLKDIAIKLGRTLEAVKTRSKRLKARTNNNSSGGGNFNWTKEEVKKLYEDLDYDELSIYLNRSRRSVEAKCEKLGISKRFPGRVSIGTMKLDKQTMLYLIDFNEYKKVGITQQSLENRFRQDKSYKILDTVLMDLNDALETEKEILKNMRPYLIKGTIRQGGTECFNYECTELADLL